VRQLRDRSRLVTGRLERRLEVEFSFCHPEI
jgi:hypothetical protein